MHKYPQHWINRAESRWYKVEEMEKKKFYSELDPTKVACSIHHINSSFRGKRDDRQENLIALSLEEHERIHNHNTFDNRKKLLDKVAFIIIQRDDRKRTLWM